MNSVWKASVLTAAIALGMAQSAAASSIILFNPNGTGSVGALQIDTLDQSPGNGLAEGITTQVLPSSFQFLYQANLGSALLGGGTQFSQGDGGHNFTFYASFGENVTGATLFNGEELGFGLNTSGTFTNSFDMYASSAPGNDLAGTGFNTGTLILSGHAVTTSFFDDFTFECSNQTSFANCQNSLNTGLYDNSGPDNWSGTQTDVGNGIANIEVQIDSADPSYFPGLLPGSVLVFALTNTTEALPFTTVNPSMAFNGASSNIGGVGSSVTNGTTGPNTGLQADASTNFLVTPTVPEPATLLLLGSGLLFGSARARRQRRNKGQ